MSDEQERLEAARLAAGLPAKGKLSADLSVVGKPINERNVSALTAIYLAGVEAHLATHPELEPIIGRAMRSDAPRWAEFLAARGVLVPASLTDDECVEALEAKICYGPDGDIPGGVDFELPELRAGLERIARGETDR